MERKCAQWTETTFSLGFILSLSCENHESPKKKCFKTLKANAGQAEGKVFINMSVCVLSPVTMLLRDDNK